MKYTSAILLLSFLLFISQISYSSVYVNENDLIEKTVLEFMERCMNKFEVEAVERCFHPDFLGLSMENDTISVATRSRIVDYVSNLNDKKHEAVRDKRTAKILSSNSVKEIGYVEFETYSGDKLLGTDYIVLFKTNGIWKFVRSITLYHSQEEEIDYDLEVAEIKKVIRESLVDAAGNHWDVKKWKKGFHPDFTGLTLVGAELEKDTFSDWEEAIKTMETREPEGHMTLITGEIPQISILGHMGIAEVKIYNGTKLSETVYIQLFRFSDGWKIVSKVGLKHNKE